MPVFPYTRRPVPPTVALLTPAAEVIDEHGRRLNLDTLEPSTRVWCSYDTAHRLVHDGKGEALCWNGEEIRWRHRRFEEGWKRRPSDVAVIRAPFYDDSPERTLAALCRWRDWLGRHGATCNSTTGSAAWSLLRATLKQPLWTSVGDPPPLLQTLGGRQALGPAGQGSFRGRLEQWDLPAAYATELGNLRYGGRWHRLAELPGGSQGPEWWARQGRPVFVRAIVRVPAGLAYGPLPRRPRGRTQAEKVATMLLGAEYPAGRVQGVWTWQEVAQALRHGCTLVRLLDAWVHLALEQPFLPWWAAIQDGRAMPGLAGLMAKMTGNALWGQFCMDGSHNGSRSIRSKNGKVSVRELPKRGGRPAAHDLAETVSGRIRARLYAAMMAAGDGLLSAHTDGIWIRRGPAVPEGWRRDQQATRLDLLDPQVLRYFRRGGGAQTVVAGVPLSLAEEWFEAKWQESGLEAA